MQCHDTNGFWAVNRLTSLGSRSRSILRHDEELQGLHQPLIPLLDAHLDERKLALFVHVGLENAFDDQDVRLGEAGEFDRVLRGRLFF